jgi:hypothetical protein
MGALGSLYRARVLPYQAVRKIQFSIGVDTKREDGYFIQLCFALAFALRSNVASIVLTNRGTVFSTSLLFLSVFRSAYFGPVNRA